MKTISPENVISNAVEKKIRELKDLCTKERLPMFVSVYVPGKETYYSDILSPMILGMELNPDRITEHLNVANGFHTTPPKEHLMRLDSDGVIIEEDEDTDEQLLAAQECAKDTELIFEDTENNE